MSNTHATPDFIEREAFAQYVETIADADRRDEKAAETPVADLNAEAAAFGL